MNFEFIVEFAKKYNIPDDLISFITTIIDRPVPIFIETIFNKSEGRIMLDIDEYRKKAFEIYGDADDSAGEVDAHVRFDGNTHPGKKALITTFSPDDVDSDFSFDLGDMLDTCDSHTITVMSGVTQLKIDYDRAEDKDIIFEFHESKCIRIVFLDEDTLHGPYFVYSKDGSLISVDYYYTGKKIAQLYCLDKPSKVYYLDCLENESKKMISATKIRPG